MFQPLTRVEIKLSFNSVSSLHRRGFTVAESTAPRPSISTVVAVAEEAEEAEEARTPTSMIWKSLRSSV